MTPLATQKRELRIATKGGTDFMLTAGITWSCIAFIWTLDFPAYDRSVFVLMLGGCFLPLAYGLSRLLRTQWKIPGNDLQPLGLWLNFAQLLYFPFLVYFLLRDPEYFLMAYAIITGAHLFPYAWFYGELAFAFAAGVISVGALLIALLGGVGATLYIPLLVAGVMFLLAGILTWRGRQLRGSKQGVPPLLHK